jgi:hypothetical protein
MHGISISSDVLMHIDCLCDSCIIRSSNIPFAGRASIGPDNVPIFKKDGKKGEDMRLGWRTILNYMWHGNPANTWDPVTHQVVPGVPNSFERDMALRYARFLWDNRQDPWNNPSVQVR